MQEKDALVEVKKDIKSQLLVEGLPTGFSFEMIYVEGGTFLMGSEDAEVISREKPMHEVRLGSYYIGRYPVTQALWEAVMGENPSFFTGESRPVEMVSWLDAQEFIKKLNGLTGKAYRLPTEAEWEYAARGGNKNRGFNYSGSNKLREVGWFDENSYSETKAVGLKRPNELGLYDMSGNVFEWCQDWNSDDYYEECHKMDLVENPQGPEEGAFRVLRGGSWSFNSQDCRCTIRNYGRPGDRDNDIGFRLVLPFQSSG